MLGTKYIYAHHLCIDLPAPYDTVWRKEIWSEMHKPGFLQKLVKFCRIVNNEIHATVKIGKYPMNLKLTKV